LGRNIRRCLGGGGDLKREKEQAGKYKRKRKEYERKEEKGM
jgi:hypothetical protein